MGKNEGGLNSSRSVFLSEDAMDDDEEYRKVAGCFVTTKRAIAFALFAIFCLIAAIAVMYFYGPNRRIIVKEVAKQENIEELLNETINNLPKELDIRLPHNLYPHNYNLKIHPVLDEYGPDNFTFTGEVKIFVTCGSNTNYIVLHFDDLEIPENEIVVWNSKYEVVIDNSTEKIETTEVTTLPPENDTFLPEEEILDATNITSSNISDDPDGDLNNSTLEYHVQRNNDTGLVALSQVLEEEPSLEHENITENETQTDEMAGQNTKIIFIEDSSEVKVIEVMKDEQFNRLWIKLENELQSGLNYTVRLKFSGLIQNNVLGLYKTSYQDSTGRKRWVATTHFETIHARRVFPCFDEPWYKSTFEIQIARRLNMTALANMPLLETIPTDKNPDWVWDKFERSFPMSTFAVSFTVCDFDNLRSDIAGGDPEVNVWAPREDLPKTLYALQIAHSMMQYLEKYFEIEYPTPKIDLLVIPHYGQIALENLGLISFRKTSIILDPKTNTMASKINVFTVVSHKIAKQWLDGMVSISWWSKYLLLEGLSGFVAELLEQNLRPRWHRYHNFPVRITHQVMYLDSLKSARSVEKDISTTNEIEQIGDSIVSEKATCLFRMLNYTITEPLLRQGLQDFFHKSLFNYPYTGNLWESFDNVIQNKSILPPELTVEKFMDTWTTQSGYPFITVDRDYNNSVLNVSQSRFVERNVTSDALWDVPLTYIDREDHTARTVWLTNSSISIPVNVSSDSWIIFNIDQTGFYRVNYDNKTWDLLKNQLLTKPELIPVSNRAQLIDDAFELARVGTIEYSVPLGLTKYIKTKENHYIPWMSALHDLMKIRNVINNYEYTGIYDKYLLDLVKQKFDVLGTEEFEEENTNEKFLRNTMTRIACELSYKPCVKWAENLYNQWMDSDDPDRHNPIPVDYRRIVQCAAIKAGDKREWDFLWSRVLSPLISATDLRRAFLSLGCTDDYSLINRYIKLSLAKNISLENVPLVWKSINHPVGLNVGFRFLRINWNEVFDAYEDAQFVFADIFKEFFSQLSTQVDLDDLTLFYQQHQETLGSLAEVIQETVNIIKTRIEWRTQHLHTIVSWLENEHFE